MSEQAGARCLLCEGVCPRCGGYVGRPAGREDWILCSLCHETFVHPRCGDRDVTYIWLGDEEVVPDRVKAIAFTPDGKIVLVGGPGEPGYWLPGGGIEDGETPEEALAREIAEETGGRLIALAPIGAQRKDVPGGPSELATYYWCAIELPDDFEPRHEVTETVTVDASDFLDTLMWGRTDPRASVILELAMAEQMSRASPGGLDHERDR